MPSDPTYFVYENWRANGHVATIHRGECPFCNFGKGTHPGSSAVNGQWHGAFETVADAAELAEQTGAVTRACEHCDPT